MTDWTEQSPREFADALRALGTRRASVLFSPDGSGAEASRPELRPLAAALLADPNYRAHEAVFFEVGSTTGALHVAFLHKTRRGQGAGGVRNWRYATLRDLYRDGLRLALGMGRKSALAGLWWGGGKGIIAAPEDATVGDRRAPLYREFGSFITSLRGAYVTAEDVGTGPDDMAEIFKTTRFTTCIPEAVGGSGNPSRATALGVVSAMEAALEHTARGSLSGKTVAMQGLGNVARFMAEELLRRGATRIIGCDISDRSLVEARRMLASERVELRLVGVDDREIFREPCDVFAPNALGAVLDPQTIETLRAPIVCGAANNQLADEHRDDRLLKDRGVVYVPDFVANRMGIVSCANEQYGSLPDDPAIMRHYGRDWDDSIYVVTRRILERADASGITSSAAANALADELSEREHPIWGHRTWSILQALAAERWAMG